MIAIHFDSVGQNGTFHVRAAEGDRDLHAADFDLHDPAAVDAFAEAVEKIVGAAGVADAIREKIAERTAGELHLIGAEAGLSNLAELRPVVVDGNLRETETMGLVSASKAGKTYLAILLGICVALGRAFLNTFATTQGKVLYIDCELHPETFWRRVAAIASALGIIRDTNGTSLSRNGR